VARPVAAPPAGPGRPPTAARLAPTLPPGFHVSEAEADADLSFGLSGSPWTLRSARGQ
jgi:hypothetical protein